MKSLLRLFFRLLYHQFAFTYDLVSGTVSLGRWKDWVMSILPFVEGRRVLEIGFGPGHLQRVLLSRGLIAVGIDESSQMARLAKRNILRWLSASTSTSGALGYSNRNSSQQRAYAQINLTRGVAQHLPFRDHSFDTVVATFPAEYIFDPVTLTEVQRVLTGDGRFVILPGAMIIGRGLWDRLMAWLFRVTRETPPNLSDILHERAKKPFAEAGFQVHIKELNVRSSIVFIMIATKATL